MSNAVIKLEGIEKYYGKRKVLDGVDMQINKGDIFGLIGRNGSGKSTIFKVVLGLSDHAGGKLSVGDEGDSLREGRAKTGFLIGTNFFPYLNAHQNIEYYRVMKGIKDKGETDRVLKIVGLDNVKSPFSHFSLGMKQRLGIANAILGNPEILILDEPTNGLDPKGIADVRELVQKLNEEYGMTVIISSHILGELQNTAHRFGILNGGRIVRTITSEDLAIGSKVVRISVDDVERAKKALTDAGIEVLGDAVEGLTLEQFYFDVVEGEKE